MLMDKPSIKAAVAPDLDVWTRERAQKEGKSLSQVVEEALRSLMDKKEAPQSPSPPPSSPT